MADNQEIPDRLEEIYTKIGNNQEVLNKLESYMDDSKAKYEDLKAIIIALGVGFLTTAFSVGFGISIKTAVWFAIGGTALSYFYDRRKR